MKRSARNPEMLNSDKKTQGLAAPRRNAPLKKIHLELKKGRRPFNKPARGGAQSCSEDCNHLIFRCYFFVFGLIFTIWMVINNFHHICW
jgi:hypothetical protein